MDMEDDRDIDVGAKAYASVSAQLDQWTSPRPKRDDSWRTYEGDSAQWMDNWATSNRNTSTVPPTPKTPMPVLTPKKRSKTSDDVMEISSTTSSAPGTPVTSNSNKKSDRSPSPLNLFQDPIGHFPSLDGTDGASLNGDDHKLYHDAFLRYTKGRKQVTHRREELGMDTEQEEMALDQDFFRSLLVSSEDNSILWSLMLELRTLGLESLFWDDSESSNRRQQMALSDAMNRFTKSPITTPHDLWQSFLGDDKNTKSLLLQRRVAIVTWLQQWFRRATVNNKKTSFVWNSPTTMWPDTSKALKNTYHQGSAKVSCIHPDAPLLVSESSTSTVPLFGDDGPKNEQLHQACLDYVLAGQIDKAVQLCAAAGQPWKGAILQGGEPYGITSTTSSSKSSNSFGNASRILWKRQLRQLAASSGTGPAETALLSVLSNDMDTALNHPLLQSWEKALYVCMSSMLSWMQDELFHRYHAQLRNSLQTCPGNHYAEIEMDHLRETASASTLTEESILEKLRASPFSAVQGKDALHQLLAALCQGKGAVLNMLRSPWYTSDEQHTYSSLLRTMTHVLLYLESVPTFDEANVLTSIKEDCVLEYLRYLSGKPELIRFSVLYASMLPVDTMLSVFPNLLTSIQVPSERKLIWTQMKDLFQQEPGLDVVVLQQTVQLMLANQDLSDVPKCQSLGWLCLSPDHYGPALVCANALVRQLLLCENSKLRIAQEFIFEYFSLSAQEPNELDSTYLSVCREYEAWQVYLSANAAFDRWRKTLEDTPPQVRKSLTTTSTAGDQAIAMQMNRREQAKSIRDSSKRIIEMAHAAQKKLDQVLQFETGWLEEFDDDEHDEDDDDETMDDDDDHDDENSKRSSELRTLQSLLLPQVVLMVHNVDTMTAAWLDALLEDATPVVGSTKKEVLGHLEEDVEGPLAPLYWIRHAKALANVVATDSICQAFNEDNLKHFLKLMKDVCILEAQEVYSK